MILVTGASGVVGSALLRELGDDCMALTHHKPVSAGSVRGDVTKPWLGLHPDDYRTLARKVDVVVHCAASVNFTAAPRQLHNVNVRGVGHVLHFVEDAEARLVHGSSAFVARAGDGSPFDAYAASKATGETLVRESGLPACITRISTVIGDSATGSITRLQSFHYLLGIALSGQLPFLPCTPGTRVDLIPQDVVAAALSTLARDTTATGDHWLTAGHAALPMERVMDIACDVAATLADKDENFRDIDQTVFHTKLIDPSIADKVINAVVTSASGKPSVIQHAANLMAAYNNAEPFPTSISSITGGPAAPTTTAMEDALRNMVRHLAGLPNTTWELH